MSLMTHSTMCMLSKNIMMIQSKSLGWNWHSLICAIHPMRMWGFLSFWFQTCHFCIIVGFFHFQLLRDGTFWNNCGFQQIWYHYSVFKCFKTMFLTVIVSGIILWHYQHTKMIFTFRWILMETSFSCFFHCINL